MIIGIEATHANNSHRTGVENYCFEVIQALKYVIPSAHEVVLYSNKPLSGGLEILPNHWRETILKWPFKKLWSQIRLSREFLRSAPDIFFAPGQLVPLISPRYSVVTVHDSAFRAYSHAYHFWGRKYLHWMNTRIVQKASVIITPSEFSKQELKKYYSVNDLKIRVIPEGYNKNLYYRNQYSLEGIKNLLSRFSITKPYLLTIGRLEEKKNTVRIVRAFNTIKQLFDYQLILVGKPGVGYNNIKEEINKSPYRSDIKEVGFVSNREVALFLQQAQVFLFPSLYEGFGLPVLEAMAVGCPVVASLGNSLEEVGGGAALYAHPLRVDDIAQKAVYLLQNEHVRKQKIMLGLERVKLFSWKRTAEEIYQVFSSLN